MTSCDVRPLFASPEQSDLPPGATGAKPAPAGGSHPMPPGPHELLRPAPGRQARAISSTGKLACLCPRLPFLQLQRARGASRVAPPPVEAWLRWPDGRESAGTVRTTPAGPMFAVENTDAVLAERHGKGAATAPLAVVLTDRVAERVGAPLRDVFAPRLPALPAPADLHGHWLGTRPRWHGLHADGRMAAEPIALTREALATIVRVAGGASSKRLDGNQQAAVQHLLAHALRQVAPQGADPTGMARVAQALGSDHELFLLYGVSGLDPPGDRASASFDAKAFEKHLAGLQPGRHSYVRVTLVHDNAAHALALAFRKEDRGRVRLAAINPAGWPQGVAGDAGDSGRDRVVPAVFRVVGVAEAATALAGLLAGRLPPGPAPEDARNWMGSGAPLHAWLTGLGTASAEGLRADFHHAGRPLRTAPQKGNDCTIERIFAFMATALPPADYKLAKAAGLNLLVQLADRLEPPGTTAPGSAVEAARCYLQWRLTSSLSGSAVARGQPPGR